MGGLLFGYDWVVIGGAKPFYESFFGIADSAIEQGLAMTIALVGCMIGACACGWLADRIGRKWTISLGLAVTILGYVVMCFAAPTGVVVGQHGEFSFPVILYPVWIIKGIGMALVHNCSFPMVVELASAKSIGRFTGYYYAASMSAQTITPVLLGLLFNMTGAWHVLPKYSLVLIILSFTCFTVFVKNIRTKKVANRKGFEALDAGD